MAPDRNEWISGSFSDRKEHAVPNGWKAGWDPELLSLLIACIHVFWNAASLS